MNLKREVWEGWTPEDFINELLPLVDLVMSGGSIIKPFKNKEELYSFIKDNQPYYKKSIPEVNDFFARRYGFIEKGENYGSRQI